VARDAGLGEIGRMGLLMTPQLGPRVRIGAVTTDLPLEITPPEDDLSVLDFCTICSKCADNCPVGAIPHGDREPIDGGLRWAIDSDTCFRYWNALGHRQRHLLPLLERGRDRLCRVHAGLPLLTPGQCGPRSRAVGDPAVRRGTSRHAQGR
jgi:ferredoxin